MPPTDQVLPAAPHVDCHTTVWPAATALPIAFIVAVIVAVVALLAASVTPFT